ncbi:MAG TPA: hypothetical protein VEX38_08065 [Fimbriimonadaceae bacterium]|nr:hypothetical protein [Fimbriimonadaceae bacterium]
MRLGRAVEAALYAVGRNFSLDLTNREVAELQKVRNEIDSAQAQILRNPSRSPEARHFQNIIRLVEAAQTIISESETVRRGRLSIQPKNNQRLLKEIREALSDPLLRFRFRSLDPIASGVQTRRNQAAHADQTGALREMDEPEYVELRKSATEIIDAAAAAMLGERARRQLGWATSVSAD